MDTKKSSHSSGNSDADSDEIALSVRPSAYIEDVAEEEENAFNICLLDDESEKAGTSDVGNVAKVGAKLDNQLEEFRQQWQDELHNRPGSRSSSPRSSHQMKNEEREDSSQKEIDLEEEARNFFIQGMQAEDDRDLTTAIYFYKKALQLDPDIESKLGNIFNLSPRERVREDSVSSVEESDTEEDLLVHFESLNVDDKALCQPNYEQRMTHISALPVELVTYILQWAVSSDLDLKSLEMFSAACRGFFICARDERLWKMACLRIWGNNLGCAKKYGGSWRKMMIERPHLLFSGCYISCIRYVRQGEQGLDQFYNPFHLVEYYRYTRFFLDGLVFMLVSAENPSQTLPKLRYKNLRCSGLLKGTYKISDNKVTCVLKRVKAEQIPNYRYKRQQRQAIQNDIDSTYYAEFELTHAKNKQQNTQLTWLKYSICTVYKSSGEENITNFNLERKSFPPLIFSLVRSYIGNTAEPLTLGD